MNAHNIRYFLLSWQAGVRLFTALSLLVLTAIPLHPAHASLQEYTILAVGVSHSSDVASAQALDYARKRAVYLAIRKLGFADPGKVAAKIAEKDLNQVIRGATVLQTRREGDRTYAQVSVSIADDVLRNLLNVQQTDQDTEGSVIAKPVRNVLVLPVLVTPKETFIWQDANALRPPLSAELLRQGHGLVILPGGDLKDLRLIDKDNVATVPTAEIKPMFEHYGADEIVIAIVTPGADMSKESTKILLRRLSGTSTRTETLELLPESAETTLPERIEQAARAIATVAVEIATSSAADEREKLAAATKIKARFIYTIPRELARLQESVRTAPGVLLLEFPQIALNNVTGIIYLEGDKAALQAYLKKKNVVVREQEGTWMISTR